VSAPAAVVLAAGEGTRMRSRLPKVAHEVAGRPMVAHVVRAARAAGAEPVVVVVGHGADAVRAALAGQPVRFAVQPQQRGTGHALACAAPALADHPGPIYVLNGDGPLLRVATLRRMAEAHAAAPDGGRGMTLVTVRAQDPTGLGRIVRGPDGALRAIVEEADADAATRRVDEVNAGLYLVDASAWARLARLGSDNAQGEAYLTDLPAEYLRDGSPVRTVAPDDPEDVLAANDREQLAGLERVARRRIARRWMHAGVTLRSPETTVLDDDVELARDVVVEPFVLLRGGTRVGEAARIGAGCVLDGCEVAPGAEVPPHTVARDRRFP
jgi:bifunctional UDP-N-acetylglucosamine pyrophosphorylase/glucosamine-1-phosphate N-acetyltransferase